MTLHTRVPSSIVASIDSLKGDTPIAGVDAEIKRASSATNEKGPVCRLLADMKLDSSMLTTSAPKLRQPFFYKIYIQFKLIWVKKKDNNNDNDKREEEKNGGALLLLII